MRILTILTGLALVLFSLAAQADIQTPPGLAEKSLQWVAPTENEDETPLTDLAGFKIHWGQASGEYTQVQDVPVATATSATVEVVMSGAPGDQVTVYFAATAYDESGNESAYSREISETFVIVDLTAPAPPSGLMFSVPVTYSCILPDGGPCSLVPAA